MMEGKKDRVGGGGMKKGEQDRNELCLKSQKSRNISLLTLRAPKRLLAHEAPGLSKFFQQKKQYLHCGNVRIILS